MMNKKDLLKSLLAGMFPLFIFIAADEFLGTKISLLIAMSFGLLQLLYTYWKDKQWDKFVVLDTLLLGFLGGVSIWLDNDIFFKLKPAFIEAILCIFLGISVFTPQNLMLQMSARYMKNMPLTELMKVQLKRSTQVLFYLFTAHTVLIVYSAYFMSKEMWGFISGGLFYALVGLYFVIEFVQSKIKNKMYQNEEWFPLVDETGQVTGQAPRSVCHQKTFLLHPVVHLHVINSKGEIYLQKRPAFKETQPDKWDTAVGGHVAYGEFIETALKRESFEELNLIDFKPELIKFYRWDSEVESELVYVFLTHYNQHIEINREELADGRFWTIAEIEEHLGKQVFTPNFENEFALLKALLQK